MVTAESLQLNVGPSLAEPEPWAEPVQGHVSAESGMLRHLSTRALARLCREQTAKFQRHESSSDAFGIELFRRAICERDQEAWDAIFTEYRTLVLAWVRRHPARTSVSDDDEYWVNRTFERLWLAVEPDRFAAFPTMAALLRYLKRCVNSVLLDEVRSRRAVDIDTVADDLADTAAVDAEHLVVGHMARNDLWAAVEEEIKDEAERLVAYLCWVLDMRPREICALHPDRFTTVAEVYSVKRNLLDRLRRNPRVRDEWE